MYYIVFIKYYTQTRRENSVIVNDYRYFINKHQDWALL